MAQTDTSDGIAVDGHDDHWIVNCPNCEHEFEYTGFFDKDDITKCSCGTQFKTRRVWLDDETYIGGD